MSDDWWKGAVWTLIGTAAVTAWGGVVAGLTVGLAALLLITVAEFITRPPRL